MIPGVRELVSLRIDQDVLEFFREEGAGWQDRINNALRKAAGKGLGADLHRRDRRRAQVEDVSC